MYVYNQMTERSIKLTSHSPSLYKRPHIRWPPRCDAPAPPSSASQSDASRWPPSELAAPTPRSRSSRAPGPRLRQHETNRHRHTSPHTPSPAPKCKPMKSLLGSRGLQAWGPWCGRGRMRVSSWICRVMGCFLSWCWRALEGKGLGETENKLNEKKITKIKQLKRN